MKLRVPLPRHDTPPECIPAIMALREAEMEKREKIKLEAETLGVEARKIIAERLHDVASGKIRPKLVNGKKDGRDGWQYLFENSANTKNEISAMSMLTTGKDPEQSNVNIALFERMKQAPISAEEAGEITVESVIEE